jgi:predicted nucleotidyltransferase
MGAVSETSLPTNNSEIFSDQLGLLPNPVQCDLLKAQNILTRNGATQIILYGSMARGDFKPESDIDLCVSGLTGVNYFRAVGECLKEIDSHVSIVPLENMQGYFRQRVLQEGKVIYER